MVGRWGGALLRRDRATGRTRGWAAGGLFSPLERFYAPFRHFMPLVGPDREKRRCGPLRASNGGARAVAGPSLWGWVEDLFHHALAVLHDPACREANAGS